LIACVLLRSESIIATLDPLFKFNFAQGLTKGKLGVLVDGLYRQNKLSILPAQILEIKHRHRFRSFKLTNSTNLCEYLLASEFSHSMGQNGL
jgi:hypothetical protein